MGAASASLGTGFRNQLDPADVVQTTLLRAAESLATSPVSDEESLLAWLRQVLKSVLVDEYRRLHRDRRDMRREQQLLESGVDDAIKPSAEIVWQHILKDLQESAAKLMPDSLPVPVPNSELIKPVVKTLPDKRRPAGCRTAPEPD